MFAAPVGAAHSVRASLDVPSRRHNFASKLSWVISPFDPPYEYGRIDSAPDSVVARFTRETMSSSASSQVDALESAFALSSLADSRVQQSIRSVHAVAEFPHLRADESVCRRASVRAVEADHLSMLNGDRETAAVRTVEWTGRVDD